VIHQNKFIVQKIFLIVDDDADDVELFCEAVNEIEPDAECITAANGEDALKKLLNIKHLPDFIFLDLNMPRMDGRQCLDELRKDKRLKKIPVIIYSTSSTQRDTDETSKLGATYFLTKPTSFQKLKSEIIHVMQMISLQQTKSVSH
jgi:CheY-like chemotaxis protein